MHSYKRCTDMKLANALPRKSEEEVHKLKRLLKGACISSLDKNDGKLHVCCTMFYKSAMDKVFDRDDLKSYEEIKITKPEEFLAKHKKGEISKTYKCDQTTDTMHEQEQHLMSTWEWFYHHKKWGHITPFDDSGGIGDA